MGHGTMVLPWCVQDTVLWLGGWDGSDVRDEIYSLNAAVTGHQWEEVATLDTPREDHCSVAYGDSVITAGGLDDDFNELSSVEVYRRGDATSTTLPVRLRVARSGHGCTIYGNKFVVTGGMDRDGDRLLSSVEISTRGEQGWGEFRIINNALPEGRGTHTATTIGLGTIYLTGGWTDSEDDPTTSIVVSRDGGNTWTTSSTALTTGRFWHTAVATPDLCQ